MYKFFKRIKVALAILIGHDSYILTEEEKYVLHSLEFLKTYKLFNEILEKDVTENSGIPRGIAYHVIKRAYFKLNKLSDY